MHKITLICSSHQEKGLCNAAELIKLLRAIGPDTIFEEVRPTDVNSPSVSTLESRAVTRYREFYSFERVPVDRHEMPQDRVAETKRVIDAVFDHVERVSTEYSVLQEKNDEARDRQGIPYLNSLACSQLMARLVEIEDKIINESGNPELIRGLAWWRDFTQRRDSAMVGIIYEYCRENAFERGVFLVGAAHRSGIVDAIEKCALVEADLIEWKFYS